MANLRVNKITGTEVFETTGSVQFDGSGDYLSLASSSDFAMGTGDFTVEFWTYPTARTTYEPYFIVGATGGLWIGKYQNNFVLRAFNVSDFIQVSTLPELNTWTHIAVTRFNSVAKIFYNGIEVGSSSNTYEFIQSSARIANDTSSNYVTGHISNLRVIKGKALYTTNFTPPTRELEVTPETVLLACQSTTNAALEKTGKTITVNGNAVANELTPGLLTDVVKSGGSSAITGSVEFDGTGDYLALSSSDFAFGTGDFTLEFWFYDTSPTSGIRRWVTSTLGEFGTPTFVIREANGSINFEGGTQTVAYPKNNSWSHIAYTRSNGMEYVFYNGVLLISHSSTRNYADTTLYIGGYYNINNTEYTQGFISNLRIVKGTALYTSNFIPPTRELKKVPGTVLLCCQDSNDPTTEATGKTITGYGDLQKADGVELISNGTFSVDTSGWSAIGATLSVSNGALRVTNNGGGNDYARENINTLEVGKKYVFTFTKVGGNNNSNVYLGTGDIASGNYQTYYGAVGILDGTYSVVFTATSTSLYIHLGSYSVDSQYVDYDNVSVTLYDPPNRASNFTPPVGFDGSVTFEGTTKINTENYFYLPTGNTESRDTNPGVRGVFSAGYQAPATPNATNVTDYINISSTGNAQDFGDSTSPRWGVTSCSSSTRGLIGGGTNPGPGRLNIIDYITIASTGNAQDFGDLTDARRALGSCSSPTRGIFAGGYLTAPEVPTTVLYNIIEYVTISSTGNAQDFGDTTFGGGYKSGFSSPTRGIIGGNYLYGATPNHNNVIDYITIASTGNAQDFGDLTQNKTAMGACSNSVRGLFGGGFTPGTINNIDYVTIASTGNAQDFGDLLQSILTIAGTSSQIRGIFGGGAPSTNVIQYVSIMSTGNSIDFGDLTVARGYFGACSNGHGGLG